MEKNQTLSLSGAAPTIALRDRILLVLFAGASLAFALFYTLVPETSPAPSLNIAAAQTALANEKAIAAKDSADQPGKNAAVSDVVAKALAFKALLNAQQQATLEQTYTPALARRWSNLPCGSNCRNGIQFGTLTADQLSAAVQVIQAAAGTAANEGSDEFNQTRLADAFLGANGGGSGYSSGIYFMAFLNTPSTSGAWMLQFGGHHYAANIAFNNGQIVSATPQFEAIEPTTFTINNQTYSPLEQERGALQNLLASLTTEQLAAARLNQTFNDVTLSPGESNGGNGTFPATRVGLQVGALSTAQKLLVLEAVKPWVRDANDIAANNLLAIYQNELDNTFIAYTGNGTSGNASSFLNVNTNYARIDGPSVWIEFICQNGVVFRNQIHYHSVWRDRQRDYGRDLSLTVPLAKRATSDFDGDGKTDLSVFRASEGNWYINRSNNGFAATNWGIASDKLAPADYDGDNKTDVAIWRESEQNFYIVNSRDNTVRIENFGLPGDVLTVGDWDGDGKADPAVYRQGAQSFFFYRGSLNNPNNNISAVEWGTSGDKPQRGDFDGDGKQDAAIFRESNNVWYILQSSNNQPRFANWGLGGDKFVPADYDGDSKTDLAVFRDGVWYILQSFDNQPRYEFFGLAGDQLAPGDYDGDGRADVAIFRDGIWYVKQSSNTAVSYSNFGFASDTPVPGAFSAP